VPPVNLSFVVPTSVLRLP